MRRKRDKNFKVPNIYRIFATDKKTANRVNLKRTVNITDSGSLNGGFQFGTIECRYFPMPVRIYSEMELAYVNKGEGLCFSGDGIAPFRTGELFFFSKHIAHHFKSAPQFYDSNYPLKSGATYIRFDASVLPAGYQTLSDCANIFALIEAGQQGVKWSVQHIDPEVIKRIDDMEGLCGLNRIVHLLKILNRLGKNLDNGVRIASLRSDESLKSKDKAYKEVVEYISHNFHTNITLDELATHVDMNRTALCRHFKAHAGRSIFDFLLEFRINFAKQQLATTHLSISEIATSAGFNNAPNFNVQFKRLTHCTPGEYRLTSINE